MLEGPLIVRLCGLMVFVELDNAPTIDRQGLQKTNRQALHRKGGNGASPAFAGQLPVEAHLSRIKIRATGSARRENVGPAEGRGGLGVHLLCLAYGWCGWAFLVTPQERRQRNRSPALAILQTLFAQ